MMRRSVLALAALLTAACSHDAAPDAEKPLPSMVDIPAGSFTMGAPKDADAQQGKPEHEVRVPAFRLSRTMVTFDQYDAFARATGRPLPQDDGLGRGNNPVFNITYGDMLAYIDWLNQTSGHTGFRLASEAEWEYAARAGTTTGFYWGDEPDPNMANIMGMGGADKWELVSPVASFPPNPWGLYDIAGNIWEMTADCLAGDYTQTPTDGSPYVSPDCSIHMTRGGDYFSSRRGQRPTARAAAHESFSSMSLGFRVAQDITPR